MYARAYALCSQPLCGSVMEGDVAPSYMRRQTKFAFIECGISQVCARYCVQLYGAWVLDVHSLSILFFLRDCGDSSL